MNKLLSIIIPAYNEENTIQKVLIKLNQIKYPCKHELILVNDASTDHTLERAIQVSPKIDNLKIISYNKNRGKGFALRRGLIHATGEIFIIQDADLEYSPEEIPKLVNFALTNSLDLVYGNRFWDKTLKKRMARPYYLGNKIISLLLSQIYQTQIKDVETCQKLFTRKVLNSMQLELDDFGFEIEFTSKALKNGFKIKEIPIVYHPRKKERGKKITWLDGIKALFYIFKFKLGKK